MRDIRRIRLRSRTAFTLVELMIVIAIFVILIAIAVPAFASMLYSSEQSLAENSLRTALAAARDAALRSPQGQDAMAVFAYDPVTHHTQAVTCVSAGTLRNSGGIVAGGSSPPPSEYEIFAAGPGSQPVQFPRGWSVRGYAPSTILQGDPNWYESTYGLSPGGHWVFPETGFYDENAVNGPQGDFRQTFAVRFEGSTGIAKFADQTSVLVLLPSPSTVFRTGGSSALTTYRADLAVDPVLFVKRVLWSPVLGSGAPRIRQDVLGFRQQSPQGSRQLATDMVIAKPVSELAVYSEKKLVQAVNAARAPAPSLRPSQQGSETLYADPDWLRTNNRRITPTFVVGMDPPSATDLQRIDDWVEGHLQNPSNPSQTIESDCRIFVLQRYLGTLQEVTGTSNGQGVGQ